MGIESIYVGKRDIYVTIDFDHKHIADKPAKRF